MPRKATISDWQPLEEGARIVRVIEGKSVLFLKDHGETIAIENRCPHRGAPLSGASLRDGSLNCPWHGLRFNLKTGECTTNPAMNLQRYGFNEQDGNAVITFLDENDLKHGIRTALIRYGATGQVGWFGTIHPIAIHRAAQLIVESALGIQLGEVLLDDEAARNQAPLQSELSGEIVRAASEEDLRRHAASNAFAAKSFETIRNRIEPLGYSLVEAEATLDEQVVVGWLLSTPDAALGPVATEIAKELSIKQVRFLERRAVEASAIPSNRYNGEKSQRAPNDPKGKSMKGPGLRQKHDLDRIWECPSCAHHERTSGTETTVVCPRCIRPESGARTNFMKLVATPATAPRRSFDVVSNTPVPMPVALILGEDTTRQSRKHALKPLAAEASSDSNQAPAAIPDEPIVEHQPSETENGLTPTIVPEDDLPQS
jgi:3-phenylpropionate/trans-cinnamate dioxygenase ferredoxin subunit